LCLLPGFGGVLSTYQFSSTSYQKTGVIYRQSQVTMHSSFSILSGDSYPFPRPPQQVNLGVQLPDGDTLELSLIVVHLKAGDTADDEARRLEAVNKLKVYIDNLLAGAPATKVLLLGDFNDDPADPLGGNVFTALLNDPAHYTLLTLPLAQANQYSYLPSHFMLDNLIVTSTLLPDTLGGDTEVLPLDQQISDYDFRDEVSDHRPVVTLIPVQ